MKGELEKYLFTSIFLRLWDCSLNISTIASINLSLIQLSCLELQLLFHRRENRSPSSRCVPNFADERNFINKECEQSVHFPAVKMTLWQHTRQSHYCKCDTCHHQLWNLQPRSFLNFRIWCCHVQTRVEIAFYLSM